MSWESSEEGCEAAADEVEVVGVHTEVHLDKVVGQVQVEVILLESFVSIHRDDDSGGTRF